SALRDILSPIRVAIPHQPSATINTLASERPAIASAVTAPSAVAAPALSRTVVRRKSTKRTRLGDEHSEQLAHAGGAVDRQVGLEHELLGSLLGTHRDAHGVRQHAA